MPRSFKLAANLAKEPRVLMRAIIGALLAANLVAAVIAFKPFGGSADDLLRQRVALSAQLKQMQARLETSKRLAEKVESARTQGDDFLAKYVMDERNNAPTILSELTRMATEAGVKPGQTQISFEAVEGSDAISMMTISQGFEGSYTSLTKLVNLLDKSPRFLIIENMQASSPQQQSGQVVNVTLKIDTFVRGEESGAAL